MPDKIKTLITNKTMVYLNQLSRKFHNSPENLISLTLKLYSTYLKKISSPENHLKEISLKVLLLLAAITEIKNPKPLKNLEEIFKETEFLDNL